MSTPVSPVAVRFGRRMAAERRRRRWTADELAARAGVERAIIYKLEHGVRGCRLDSAALLAAALEISLDGLAGPCARCGDSPHPGYTCGACGAVGQEPQS